MHCKGSGRAAAGFCDGWRKRGDKMHFCATGRISQIEEGAELLTGGPGKPQGLEAGYFVKPTVFANDTPYGLQAYVSSTDLARANRVAGRLIAGRVHINGVHDDQIAPFGGFKQSGIGREFGPYGLDSYLEPKVILGAAAQYPD